MLAGVLLHMIESSRPINRSRNLAGRNFTVEDMKDIARIIFDNLQNARFPQKSGIVWLTSRFGIESRLVKDDCRHFLNQAPIDHGSGKLPEVRIFVI
jgi:hypothetical protein